MKIRSLVFSTLSFTRFCTFPFMCLYFVSYSAALPFLLIFLHGISGFGQCSNVFLWMTTIQCIVNDKATLKHPWDLNFSSEIIRGIFCTSFRNCIPSNNSDRVIFRVPVFKQENVPCKNSNIQHTIRHNYFVKQLIPQS